MFRKIIIPIFLEESVMKKYDVAIVGGGFAGFAAALAAARGGASVILIDKSGCLGGAAVNCLVNPFMRNWTTVNDQRLDLSAGIFLEIIEKMKKRQAMWHECFLEEELKALFNDMAEEAGIDLLFHADLFKADTSDGRITTLYFAGRNGVLSLEADYFIDASGDGILSFLSGCPTTLGRSDGLCQPMTLCFRVGNVDVDAFFKGYKALTEKHAKALENGELINPRENILVFKYPINNVLHFNTTRVIKLDPTDPFDYTKAEIESRKQVMEMFSFLKKNADGFENAYLMMTAAEIGVRESRMIVGDHLLTEKECKECTVFDDSIAACNYDIDIHNPEGTGTSIYSFKPGTYYTIPYRCLIPKSVSNMLVAGRCISADHSAQASLRIMPTVCSIGEAAGSAIALAVRDKTDTRSIDVNELRNILTQNGAFTG